MNQIGQGGILTPAKQAHQIELALPVPAQVNRGISPLQIHHEGHYLGAQEPVDLMQGQQAPIIKDLEGKRKRDLRNK
jgi:hypothetical protein